jgi:predicted RNA binding protein YcfA (HicA-like mRNA interferase family)
VEVRHLLKALKDEGWYLGNAADGVRQYVHRSRPGLIVTVAGRYGDDLGPDTEASVTRHAELPR